MDLIILVGGRPTPLKNMKVSWDDYSKYDMEKMFQTTNQLYDYHVVIIATLSSPKLGS